MLKQITLTILLFVMFVLSLPDRGDAGDATAMHLYPTPNLTQTSGSTIFWPYVSANDGITYNAGTGVFTLPAGTYQFQALKPVAGPAQTARLEWRDAATNAAIVMGTTATVADTNFGMLNTQFIKQESVVQSATFPTTTGVKVVVVLTPTLPALVVAGETVFATIATIPAGLSTVVPPIATAAGITTIQGTAVQHCPPTGSCMGISPAPAPIYVFGANDSTAVVGSDTTLFTMPAITPLPGRPIRIHATIGKSDQVTQHYATFRLLKSGIEIARFADRCPGPAGESCSFSLDWIDNAITGIPVVYTLVWNASLNTSVSRSATNGYEKRVMVLMP